MSLNIPCSYCRAKLQKSTDGGASFAAVDPFPAQEGGPTGGSVAYGGVRAARGDVNKVWWHGLYTANQAEQWVLDDNVGGSGAFRMVWFGGKLYAFFSGSGCWRCDSPGNWTQVFSGNPGKGCLWNNQLFCQKDQYEIWSSSDGVNWSLDCDVRVVTGIATVRDSSGVNGGPSKLYVGCWDTAGGGNRYILERTTAGVWSVAMGPFVELVAGDVMGGCGNYDYYWAQSGAKLRRWTGAAWEDVPGFNGENTTLTYDTTLNKLFAKEDDNVGNDHWIYSLDSVSDVWTQENSHLGSNSTGCWISEGGPDDLLWYAASGRVYKRESGAWSLVSASGLSLYAAMVGHYGDDYLFGGASGKVYRYQPATRYFHLRKSEDGGSTWGEETTPDIDDAHILTSLRINPGDDDRVVVYNRGLDDLLRTLVGGGGAGNWTVLDSAMDFDLSDLIIDEFEGDPDLHLHVSNKDAGSVLVEETEDEAASWQDNTGDLPAADGTTCIVKPRIV